VKIQLWEDIFLKDVQSQALSGITTNSWEERMTNPDYYSGMELIGVEWDLTKDCVTLEFAAEPTENTGQQTDNHGRMTTTNLYEILIRFLNVSSALGDPQSYSQTQNKRTLVTQMLRNCPIQVHSDDASFYYQGAWEDLARENGTVFPFQGTPGNGIWRSYHAASGNLRRSNVRITKHIQQALDMLSSLTDKISQQLEVVDASAEPVAHPEMGVWEISTTNPGDPVEPIEAKTRNQARHIYAKTYGVPYVNTRTAKISA